MSISDNDQCRALIGSGERCSRPAQDDEFCFQHDESDPTVDETSDDGSTGTPSEGNGTEADSSERAESDGGSPTGDDSMTDTAVNTDGSIDTDDAESESTESGSQNAESGDAGGASSVIQEVRNTAQMVSRDLIGSQPDAVIGIASTEDGWQVTLEVVERSAVPDTQDILGRYEVNLDSDYSPTGYRRLERYRRGDTEREVIE